MRCELLILVLGGVLALMVRADTITWSYATGWDKGFVLTVDSEQSKVRLLDRRTGKKQFKVLHNPKEALKYLETLIRKVKDQVTGEDADDGPINEIVLVTKKGVTQRKIFDVSPPNLLFRHTIPYPAKAEVAGAEQFVRQVDAYLLLNQLRELKNAYFGAKDQPRPEGQGVSPSPSSEAKSEE